MASDGLPPSRDKCVIWMQPSSQSGQLTASAGIRPWILERDWWKLLQFIRITIYHPWVGMIRSIWHAAYLTVCMLIEPRYSRQFRLRQVWVRRNRSGRNNGDWKEKEERKAMSDTLYAKWSALLGGQRKWTLLVFWHCHVISWCCTFGHSPYTKAPDSQVGAPRMTSMQSTTCTSDDYSHVCVLALLALKQEMTVPFPASCQLKVGTMATCPLDFHSCSDQAPVLIYPPMKPLIPPPL